MKFIETIKVKGRKIINPEYHIIRANQTIYDHYECKFDFEYIIKIIKKNIFNNITSDTYKLRIVYSLDNFEWSIEKYILKQVKTLQIVKTKDYFYKYKYFDREQLDKLYSERGDADNIIITVNDFITDSYYANLVFQKNDKYFTPSTFLLRGTKQKFYLDKNIVEEIEIKEKDIYKYDSIHLINALIDIKEIIIDTKNIKPSL